MSVTALESELHARLASRAAGRWPKSKGDLHIFLAFGTSNWEAVLPRALSPFGKVTVFDWRSRGFQESEAGWLLQRDRMNARMLEEFNQANALEPVDAVAAYVSGYTVSPRVLREMAAHGAAIFNFCWDDKLFFTGRVVGGRYQGPAAIADAVDLNLTNAPESLINNQVHDGLALFWPEAAHPEIHRPFEVPFEFDVSFVEPVTAGGRISSAG